MEHRCTAFNFVSEWLGGGRPAWYAKHPEALWNVSRRNIDKYQTPNIIRRTLYRNSCVHLLCNQWHTGTGSPGPPVGYIEPWCHSRGSQRNRGWPSLAQWIQLQMGGETKARQRKNWRWKKRVCHFVTTLQHYLAWVFCLFVIFSLKNIFTFVALWYCMLLLKEQLWAVQVAPWENTDNGLFSNHIELHICT